jgi:peptide/nickel transport system permease protein
VSFTQYPRDVSDLILERLPRTLILFTSSLLLAYAVGFFLGKVLAWRRNKRGETALTVAGVTLYTVFYPWFALVMLFLFGYQLGWFPLGRFIDASDWSDAPVMLGSPLTPNRVITWLILTSGLAALLFLALRIGVGRLPSERRRIPTIVGTVLIVAAFLFFWLATPIAPYARDIVEHLILPVVTLALVTFAGVMLLTRSSMLETMKEDYILTARAKGLPDSEIRDHHAARNALMPVVTSLVLALAFVISGGIITESIFSYPGLGEQLLFATQFEDIPLAAGTLGFIAVLALIGHVVADIVYVYIDPRIRYA